MSFTHYSLYSVCYRNYCLLTHILLNHHRDGYSSGGGGGGGGGGGAAEEEICWLHPFTHPLLSIAAIFCNFLDLPMHHVPVRRFCGCSRDMKFEGWPYPGYEFVPKNITKLEKVSLCQGWPL